MFSALSQDPPHTLRPFRGPMTTIGTVLQQIRGPRGERSVLVRSVTEDVVRHVQPKDYLSEILAVRNFVATHCRYTNDPLTTEWVKDPQRMIEEILAKGSTLVDCDEIASLNATMCRQLGRETGLVVVGFTANPNSFSHVFDVTKEPKTGKNIVLDPVAGTDEAKMLARVKTYKIFPVN